jgi:hypothetical protein
MQLLNSSLRPAFDLRSRTATLPYPPEMMCIAELITPVDIAHTWSRQRARPEDREKESFCPFVLFWKFEQSSGIVVHLALSTGRVEAAT